MKNIYIPLYLCLHYTTIFINIVCYIFNLLHHNLRDLFMKRLLFIVLIAMFITPAHAKDSCASVLCLAGMYQGAGKSSECNSPVSDYFSIRVFKKGKFKASRTASARLSYLNSCPSHSGWASKINSSFGYLYNG